VAISRAGCGLTFELRFTVLFNSGAIMYLVHGLGDLVESMVNVELCRNCCHKISESGAEHQRRGEWRIHFGDGPLYRAGHYLGLVLVILSQD
jgi:hypothetical protein